MAHAEDGSSQGSWIRPGRLVEHENIIWELEDLHGQIEALFARFPKERRAKALEEVAGRTPEEAAAFKAKAQAIRDSM